MSHYISPEQRQIRELRSKINSMTARNEKEARTNSRLRSDIDTIRRQQQKENERLVRQMEQQQEAARKDRVQLSSTIRELDLQVKERERLQQQRIQTMQRQHENQVRQLEEQFQSEHQGLKDEIRQTRADLKRGLSDLRSETDRKLRLQREEVQRTINTTAERLQDQISSVDQKVTSLARQIAQREQGDRELAEYWAQESARMLSQIQETFKPQLQDPKRIAVLERKIRQAAGDIELGQYQSSLTAGREAFFDALDLKEELAAAELEWNYWYNAVKARESAVLTDLASAENRIYEIETEDGIVEYSNGIDYWTFGQLSVFQNQLNELRNRIQDTETMTLAELQEAEEQMHALQEQLSLIENAAHINVAMSVSRYETARKIGRILDENYAMIDADGEFFAREDREEYHAIFQNPSTGDQIAVVITPILDEAGIVTNHVELIVGHTDNNPVTRDRIAREVAEKLRMSGVDGCSFPCSGRYGDATLQETVRVGDIEAVENGEEKARAKLPEGTARTEDEFSRVKRKVRES